MSPFDSQTTGPIAHYQRVSSIEAFGQNSGYMRNGSLNSNYAAKIERHQLLTKQLVNPIKAVPYREYIRDQSTHSAASLQ
jgi:hypothetical protein